MNSGNADKNFFAKYESLSDEEIVSLANSGDKAALEFIMNKYKNLVRSKSKTYFLAGADKEDIVQEGMIGLFKAIRDYDDSKLSQFKTFAELCVKRQIITAVKTSTRQKHLPLNTYVSLSKPMYDDESDKTVIDLFAQGEHFDPEEKILTDESYAIYQTKINDILSEFERTVLGLYVEGKSYQVIAALIGRTPKSIDNALQRIKRKLEVIKSAE